MQTCYAERVAESDVKNFQLRIPSDVHERLVRLTDGYGKSLHWVILHAIDVAMPTMERQAREVQRIIGESPSS